MQCIAFATADQYHLPTLCHDLISQGFCEIDLPRGTIPNYSVFQGVECDSEPLTHFDFRCLKRAGDQHRNGCKTR